MSEHNNLSSTPGSIATHNATSLRAANNEELHQLVETLRECGVDEEEAATLVERARVAVFPKYRTGYSGYWDKVMVVVYDGAPEFTSTYIWDKGQIKQVDIKEMLNAQPLSEQAPSG